MNIEKLIKNCAKGNSKSQSILYEKYKDALYAISLKYCATKEAAQDNLQDAFIEIFKNIKKYNGKGSFEGWIKKITINKAIDKFKYDIKTKPLDNFLFKEKQEEITLNNIDNVPLSIILEYIQNLPPQYRLVFNLYELDNYSHKEISELLNISIGTSKSNLFRAKKLLKTAIEKYQNKVKHEA
ncbi:RNA polymerase sigma factor [Tenacibaculum geojense]|uniref:RNA polymerase sigma factor n=1 Tax=Tenacibaculum geojense TaxID=915352 RepID=A0ABW3JW44_9FLAO